MAREEAGRENEDMGSCVCPFCENVLEMPAPWCAVCGVQIRLCVVCEEALPKDATVCPGCGARNEE
jgi:hypothetical protein